MKRHLIGPVLLAALLAGGAAQIVQDQCGPFTDVTPAFCPFILELYYLGITAGTSATTFSPDDPLTRGQGAVFIAKGLNQSLARSSRRAALGQWWVPQGAQSMNAIPLTGSPRQVRSDGADVWVATLDGVVTRVRASDGKVLATWNGVSSAECVLVAMGRIFVTGSALFGQPPGFLYMIDPTQSGQEAVVVADTLGMHAQDIAFDGARIWTANENGTVSIVTPTSTLPWSVDTIAVGQASNRCILWDGESMWLGSGSELLRLDSNGNVTQTVAVEFAAGQAAFDGENIWLPGVSVIGVVQAHSGTVVATLEGNGLDAPWAATFDGQRVLVTNGNVGASTVSLWNAADLAPLGYAFVTAGFGIRGACSDGVNFWIALDGPHGLERF